LEEVIVLSKSANQIVEGRAGAAPSRRASAALKRRAVADLVGDDTELSARLKAVRHFGATVRTSEYHLTNACNIRCEGCWFFEFGHDKKVRELKSLEQLEAFVLAERERRVTSALLIGGEPTLFPERIRVFCRHMRYVTISSNGLRSLPREPIFERVNILLTVFGGGLLDDKLRAIKPSGQRFTDLFQTMLDNYRDDPRANFVYCVTELGIEYIEDTVRRIAENGNRVTFSFFSEYHADQAIRDQKTSELLAEVLRVRALYPDAVVSHPMHIRGVITGRSYWGSFGYETCPSISVDHPAHAERRATGKPSLPLFNTYNADFKTIEFCCTSGHCDKCRDSQAVYSWLMCSMNDAADTREHLVEWLGMAESYWRQFVWSPYHVERRSAPRPATAYR
jgi:organic radical activating enzyme